VSSVSTGNHPWYHTEQTELDFTVQTVWFLPSIPVKRHIFSAAVLLQYTFLKLVNRTSCSWYDSVVRPSVRLSVCLWHCVLWLNSIFKWIVNRKCPHPTNTILQLSTSYTDPECPKTMPCNYYMEGVHQNKKAWKVYFRLKINEYDQLFIGNSWIFFVFWVKCRL